MTDQVNNEVKEAAEEVVEAAEAVVEAAEEAKEAAEEVAEAVQEAPAEAAAPAEKAAPTGKFADLIKEIEELTALELSELVKALEDRFGVSAAAPVAMMGAMPAGGAAEAAEEKTAYNVVLTNAGGNKIAAIKAVREILPELGLVEAKGLVESAPKAVKENVPTEEAKAIKEKLEAAGATVELQ